VAKKEEGFNKQGDGLVKIAGTDFTYKPVLENPKEYEETVGDQSTFTIDPKP
jgi:hypothetical protein